MSYIARSNAYRDSEAARKKHRKGFLIGALVLAVIAAIGYIPSWAITSVTSWIGNWKYEEVWSNVAPWTWTTTGVIGLFIAVGFVVYYYMTVIIPIMSTQSTFYDGLDGRAGNAWATWAER